jgi:hypothetical protein
MLRMQSLIRIAVGITAVGLLAPLANAQWSLLAPGTREGSPGNNRYYYLVWASPIPGMETQFNDWYQNNHMGDLVQLPGWVGAQRFRIVADVGTRPTKLGYDAGYLIVWDVDEKDFATANKFVTDALRGGKSRRGAGFNYGGDNGGSGTYRVVSPRLARPDGKSWTKLDANDPTQTRPGRFMLMEFTNAAPGKEAEFDKGNQEHIQQMLQLPGFLATQRLVNDAAPTARGTPYKPRYLTIYELEGKNAAELNKVLGEATKAGTVKPNPAASAADAQIVFWEPISPYITREDFER